MNQDKEEKPERVILGEPNNICLTLLFVSIIIGMAFLVMSFFHDNVRGKNMRLCNNIGGEPYTYALDQSEWLCQLPNGRIINLDNGKLVNQSELLE